MNGFQCSVDPLTLDIRPVHRYVFFCDEDPLVPPNSQRGYSSPPRPKLRTTSLNYPLQITYLPYIPSPVRTLSRSVTYIDINLHKLKWDNLGKPL